MLRPEMTIFTVSVPSHHTFNSLLADLFPQLAGAYLDTRVAQCCPCESPMHVLYLVSDDWIRSGTGHHDIVPSGCHLFSIEMCIAKRVADHLEKYYDNLQRSDNDLEYLHEPTTGGHTSVVRTCSSLVDMVFQVLCFPSCKHLEVSNYMKPKVCGFSSCTSKIAIVMLL